MSANSANHASSTTKCCYSAVLRRLLCSGSLPTHPSDQFDDPTAGNCLKPEENVKQAVSSTNPGVVARLMGLDSFPDTPSAQKGKNLGSFFRSRSVSSIDFISHLGSVNKHHRRVRTSVSFREGINYHHDCVGVVPNLERVGEIGEKVNKKEKRGGSGNSERLGEKNVINKKSGKKVEMVEQRRSGFVKPSHKKDLQLHGKKREGLRAKREEIMPSKCLKKRPNKNLARKVHPEGIAPGVIRVSGGVGSNSRSPYSNRAHSHNVEVRAISKGKKEKKLKNKESNCYYKRMVEMICTLTEESFLSEKWMYESVLKFDDFEETCKQLGQEILEVLLKQFVDELVRPTLWHNE